MSMKIIGHRGARGLAPENTIVSLQKGLEHHVDMLEFDLRVTKDNVVILHHDPTLTDPNGNRLVVKDTPYKELLEHKADIPTFEEVLDKIGHPVRLYVEVKPEADTKPIIKIFKACLAKGWKPEYFYLGSFSQKILLELDKGLPEIQKLVIENWSGVRAHWRARQLRTKTVCMNERWLWSGFIKSVQRSGWELYTYTLNDVAKAKRWEKYGLAGVVTDFPDRFETP